MKYDIYKVAHFFYYYYWLRIRNDWSTSAALFYIANRKSIAQSVQLCDGEDKDVTPTCKQAVIGLVQFKCNQSTPRHTDTKLPTHHAVFAPYSSSLTGSYHSRAPSEKASCTIKLLSSAPCQWMHPGLHQIISPTEMRIGF